MPGDYSRKSFDRKKHYRGVLMQQGRVQLDADWNEQQDIQSYRSETETNDVIGPCGVPKAGDGFMIATDGSNLSIKPGRIYVDGLLCELESQATYTSQPYYPNPDEFTSPLGSPLASPLTSPPSSSQLKLEDGLYLVYVDAWQREITALDDPLIREKALGGPDTATRLQAVWQVRLLRVTTGNGEVTCKTPLPEYLQRIAAGTGKLTAQTKKADDPKNPCLLPPQAGYLRLENQLYRVEVHKGGDRSAATFRWSRDNATVETSVQMVSGSLLAVSEVGKDEVLGFHDGDWVELVTEEAALNRTPFPLMQIDHVEPATREIRLKASVPAQANVPGLKLRRWDQAGNAVTADGVPMALANLIDLEGGIQVSFSAGSFRSGDYWLIPARTVTGEIEWPPYEIPNTNPHALLPNGVQHHYCQLALVEVQGGVIQLKEDCRKRFPALTEICAEDICFDNRVCDLVNARTVQDALDALCQKQTHGCCLVAIPGPNWETVFDKIEDGQDAHVCFQVGTYPLAKPVSLTNKGYLKITGCGPGTRILAPTAESALVFEGCKGVYVRDLYLESGIAASQAEARDLNATLTIKNCAEASLESLSLRCGAAAVRAAACILVRNEAAAPTERLDGHPVRIRQCRLQIGHQQVGILLVNVSRAHVEDNILAIYEKPESLRRTNLLNDRRNRAALRSRIFSNVHPGREAPASAETNASVTFGNHSIRFRTEPSLVRAWQSLIDAHPPSGIQGPNDLASYARRLAGRLLVDPQVRSRLRPFEIWFEAVLRDDPAVGSQGIVVGGTSARDVRILNNTVSGFLQGIHVGLSHREPRPGAPDIAGTVLIASNTVEVSLPAEGVRERHGIFVGNCDSLIVQDNYVTVNRFSQTGLLPIEGIRIYGHIGRMMIVRQNHLVNVSTGILVRPLGPNATSNQVMQWLVENNMIPGSSFPVNAPGKVRSANNFA